METQIDQTTTICVSRRNHQLLLQLGKKGESFDDILTQILDFIASHTVPITTEKANSDERDTVDEEVSDSDDIQGSEENRSHEQHPTTTTTTTTTNNSTF